MNRRILQSLQRQSPAVVFSLCIVLVGVIALFDYWTGTDVSLITFYWVPVSIATWTVGLGAGVLLSFLGLAAAMTTDYLGGMRYPGLFVLGWHILMRLTSFLAFVWALTLLRRAFESEAAARAELSAAKEELERLVRLRTKNLERAVGQLRAFAYSAAHDLRRPARAVAVYSDILIQKEQGLSQDGTRYLGRLRVAAQELRQMLDGMLALTHLAQERPAYEPLDLGALAQGVVDKLKAGEPSRRIVFVASGALDAEGDPKLLRALLEKLLENAWKFTSGTPAPWIELRSETRGDEIVYLVRDNGPGFDPANAARLFKPFERLPNANGFPGVGIGLAAAARIVEAHGGRIWAESALNEGAAVCFTLGRPA